MLKIRTMLAFLFVIQVICLHSQPLGNLVTYAGGTGNDGFYDAMQLSDGTFLVCGYSDDLDWVPAGAEIVELPSGNINNDLGTNRYGLMVRFSSNLQDILQVVHFPRGTVEDIRFMKTSNLRGEPTADLFISGNTSDTYDNDGGYFLARLNNNFVDGTPTAMVWHRNVWAMSYAKAFHPWDVNSNNEVVYVSGEAHGYNWSAIYWLDQNGNRKVVEHWRTHAKTTGGEWIGTPASNYSGGTSGLNYSLIAMKSWGRCELRSWNTEDYNLIQNDGNGGTKKGKWPLDLLFDSPCDINNPVANGPGYTGYSNESCCPVYGGSSVLFDRYSGELYLGMNMKSIGPTGSPDFEPAVIKMSSQGEMLWWSRLYHEINPAGDTMISIPDQYVDALALDYSQGLDNPMLVVNGRTHGNNTENLWEGNAIFANPNSTSFQQQFTGVQGDIHLSWIGKLRGSDGVLMNATYVGELSEASPNLGTAHPDPNLDGWPNPNTGWPNLNTTYLAKNAMKVSANGDVIVIGEGRRTITTSDAWQKMVKPFWGGQSCWNHFVRMYKSDLSKPLYSSLVVGAWDTLTQAGGSNIELYGVCKTSAGILAVGKSEVDLQGIESGNPMPTTSAPSWGSSLPSKESFVIAFLSSASTQNPDDGPSQPTQLEIRHQPKLKVYPNPSSGFAVIETNGFSNSNQPTLTDIYGRSVAAEFTKSSSYSYQINTSALSNGVYLVNCGGNIGKLVVNHR